MKNKQCRFIIIFYFFFSSCTPSKIKTELITISVLLPLVGEDSDEGLRALNGIQLAKKEINEAGRHGVSAKVKRK